MEHLLRAAAAITNETDFVVLGSQALLAAVPVLPEPLARSMELDLYPLHNPSAADLIDGSIGELSPFHETYGYYAHGVGPETAVLPRNWCDRTITICDAKTGSARGICVAPGDLAIAKLIAGREKDLVFVDAMLREGIIRRETIMDLLNEVPDGQRDIASRNLIAKGQH